MRSILRGAKHPHDRCETGASPRPFTARTRGHHGASGGEKSGLAAMAARLRGSVALRLATTAILAFAPLLSSSDADADDTKLVDEGRVTIDVDADSSDVVIERRASTVESLQTNYGIPLYSVSEQWVPACVVPCSVRVDAHSYYRVEGDGVAPSLHFTLPRRPDTADPIKLHVHARSGFLHSLGIGMSIVGGVAFVVGGISTLYAPSITNTSVESSVRQVGVVILVSGAVLLLAGIPMWLATYSNVRTDDGRVLRRATPTPAVADRAPSIARPDRE